ncbi:hypothetical protein TCAL_00078 [Tigriopus californicus]|uniref:Cullin N-terminal domain-containing protein n=1 Tax=Tigriopus californicus TaxID=6832 RepID=A0A553PFN9_TIGCA|nr:CDK2-associated and cullin domain-containing protein 1-like [Tigriopus californicus]TRY76489.1 hypothetical protein TCAL_00078 [Tigriopus californicus]|eukprot:TCALIF_00078-PA protein Name:"Similar to Cacul1 CDK2-associated and cullin domain-containing protein 1 (Mus musculus)" AED:0.01 eAED:0.01 QI:44/1/0.5/1/1/1/2/0/282
MFVSLPAVDVVAEAGTVQEFKSEPCPVVLLNRRVLCPVAIMSLVGLGLGDLDETSYNEKYWIPLRGMLEIIFHQPAGSYQPVSYEETYTLIYKCVSMRSAERLFRDIVQFVESVIQGWQIGLERVSGSPTLFVEAFTKTLEQYFHATSTLLPVCTYLDKSYVKIRIGSTMELFLNGVFTRGIQRENIQCFLKLLSEARSQPFTISPQVMQRSVQYLHRLDASLVSLDWELFSAFLTNVRPAMLECDLEAQIEADRKLQAELRESGFASGESKSRKRIFDADH